jgi:ubiquitin C-terminal hydrolase
MLSVILETLHEDCNQVSKKPYVEQKDSADRPDEVVAKEFWDGFLQRDKSIFINLFYGQLKSRVQCSSCSNISITFDPFNVVSLPIPTSVKSKPNFITVTYYPINIIMPIVQFKIDVDLQRGRGADLIESINESV